MTTILSHRRKADRQRMAEMICTLAERHGATATIKPDPLDPRHSLWVTIKANPAHVTIDLDGTIRDPGWLTPWNIEHTSQARFSDRFGVAVRDEVNPYHRRKCMGYASTFTRLLEEPARR